MSLGLLNNSASPSTPASAKVGFWANLNKRMFQKDDTGLEWPLASPFRVNVMDYGAKGDGTTNDTAAIQSAINAAGAMGVSGRGVDVHFPAGVYRLNTATPITVPFNNVMLVGEGWQSTVLYYDAATTGDVVQIGNGASKAGCGMADMSVWKSAVGTTGANININAMNDCLIRNVVVNNCFQGILVQGASIKVWIQQGEVNNISTTASAAGIKVLNGAAGDTYIENIVMSNNPASKGTVGIQIVQSGHCRISYCNITSCVKGLLVDPTTSQDVSYLFINESLFDSCGSHAAHFNATTAASSRIRSVICVNTWFSGTTVAGSGIELTATGGAICDGISFIGCRILNNFNHGVTYNAGVANVSFTECTVAGNGQQTINTYDGFSVVANASDLMIDACKIGTAGTATNQQRYAINVAAGTGARLVFVGNDCQTNGTLGTHGYINLGAITGGGNFMDNNLPLSGVARGDSRVAATAAITTTETIVTPATAFFNRLMANGMRAGTTYRFVIWGTCTVSTAASTWIARIRLGTANTTADTAILTGETVTSGAVGTSTFEITILVTCRTVGASATFHGNIKALNSSSTLGLLPNLGRNLATPTFAAGNTQNANYINATIVGSTNVSITVQGATMEVVAP